MTDPLDQAIADAPDQVTVTMAAVPLQLAPLGRPAEIHVPVDMTEREAMELAALILTKVLPLLARQRPTSRLILPT